MGTTGMPFVRLKSLPSSAAAEGALLGSSGSSNPQFRSGIFPRVRRRGANDDETKGRLGVTEEELPSKFDSSGWLDALRRPNLLTDLLPPGREARDLDGSASSLSIEAGRSLNLT